MIENSLNTEHPLDAKMLKKNQFKMRHVMQKYKNQLAAGPISILRTK